MVKSSSFGGLPKMFSQYGKSKIVVLPAPFDATSTWGKGADKGPEAIFGASANMELYDIETGSSVYEKGIFTDRPVPEKKSPEKMVKQVHARVKKHLANGKFVVLLGGEHSVSEGTIKAHVENFKDVSVLQIDAHSDLRDEYHGSKHNHACIMARAREIAPIVQAGIRSMSEEEKRNMDKSRVFFAHEIAGREDWMDHAVAKLSENVYITFDLDAFDSSLMPSTGTPEPGGLFWQETVKFLRHVFTHRNVIGFDVVELAPSRHNKAPDFVAAKLVYTMLSYKFGLKKLI